MVDCQMVRSDGPSYFDVLNCAMHGRCMVDNPVLACGFVGDREMRWTARVLKFRLKPRVGESRV